MPELVETSEEDLLEVAAARVQERRLRGGYHKPLLLPETRCATAR
jgi:hypothetical protein